MRIDRSVRGAHAIAVLARRDYVELSQIWPGTANRNLTADLVEVARTVVYLAVSIPLYLMASVALAFALYLRCAGSLLHAE